MRRLHLGIGGGIVAAAGLAAWWFLTPHRLGLTDPRMVLVSGDATADTRHVHAGQVVAAGATITTSGGGVACFSVHASRVCLGSGSQVHLAELGPHAARLEADHGTVVLRSTDDDLRLTLPVGSVEVQDGVTSVEIGSGDIVVRALQGSVSAQGGARPVASLASPGAITLRDGNRAPPSPQVEREELKVTELARRWQGTAGAIIQYNGVHGRMEIDGQDIGRAPASVLLEEGEHTLVVRDGPHETTRETLRIGGGQTVVRGG